MQELPFDPNDGTVLESVKTIPVFDSLDEESLKSLLRGSSIRRYATGEVVIDQGAYDQWVYFLVYGELEVSVSGKVVGHLRRLGDLFGEMGIIDGSPRSATITATKGTLCVALEGSGIDTLGGGQRIFTQAIMYHLFAQVMAVRLRDTSRQLSELQREMDALKKKYGEA